MSDKKVISIRSRIKKNNIFYSEEDIETILEDTIARDDETIKSFNTIIDIIDDRNKKLNKEWNHTDKHKILLLLLERKNIIKNLSLLIERNI